jgi:hypothetical protein
MSEDELKVTRRLFLRHSAMATAMSATWYSIAMKTDAVARAADELPGTPMSMSDAILPYVYHE